MNTVMGEMTRDDLINYFVDKHESKFVSKEQYREQINKYDTDYIIKAYKIEKMREENESYILENGAVTYHIDFPEENSKDVAEFMFNHGMFTMFHGEIDYRCRNGESSRLLGVPEKFINELEKHFNIKRSGKMYILGKNDINKYQVGDKVKFITSGIFGNNMEQGTIHLIEDDTIKIRKYRSRKYLYTFNAGDEVNIEKIKKFEKN